ncbi:MAG: effector binding domain-containing protein [Arcobacter sp.]|nr:effector binding domain-containing protein [Arcobacter sp.]
MQKIKLESFTISGIKTRTNNKNEMNPNTSKIATLWQEFYQDEVAKKLNSSEIYGVYYNYESDVNGDFDVMAGCKGANNEYENISIEEGKYLVFKKSGTMPQAVIDVWSEIWEYFSSKSKEIRTYKYDFEKYASANEVEIYIGIE